MVAEPAMVASWLKIGIVGLALAVPVAVGVLALVLIYVVRRNRSKAAAGRTDAAAPAPITPTARPCPQCGAARPPGVLDGLCPACLLQQGAGLDSGTQPRRAPFEPPAVAEMARLFPQFEIIELIGKGGMGAVYKARQPALDRLVALKILPSQAGGGADFAERFNREARALAKLNHPNIVAVHEFGQVETLHYFIMEYVDGANLRQLERNGRLSPRQALQIVPEICDALQYAHDEGVVHRDIKPENVLIDRKGRVKIADFGLAKILGREAQDLRLTAVGQVMGTPHYMSPEQVEHPLDVDHRADIYSLGVVFYEMLTGELPLGRFAPPSRKVELDVRLDDVVLRALEKEPERRYQHASEVRTAVDTIAQGPAPATATPAAADVRTWAPRQPPLVREICGHLTETERREVMGRGLLFGFWNAATFFVPFFVIFYVPAPVGWILGGGALLLGLSFYPLWRRMEREHLCGTVWARQRGITPEQIREAMSNRWRGALVGVRNGRRVIRWPQVLLVATLLAVVGVVALWGLSGYLLGSSTTHLRPSPAMVLMAVMPLLALGAFVIQRSWAQPLERLPRLDAPLAPPPPPDDVATAAARGQVRIPAIGLAIANLLSLVVLGGALAVWVLGAAYAVCRQVNHIGAVPFAGPAVVMIPVLLVWTGLVITSLIGARRMRHLQDYRLAVTGSILAIVTSPHLGLLFGVWALIVLMRPEVRQAFDRGHGLPPRSGNGGNAVVAVIAIILGALALLGVTLVGLVLLYTLLARSKPALQVLAPREAAVTQPGKTVLSAPARNAVCAVRCTASKATIEYETDDAYEVFLFVGSGSPGWSAWHAGSNAVRATVEASDQIKMEDGSLGRGFIFQTAGSTAYVAITPAGPVPFGELVFREDAAITAKDGTFTFADIQQADGTRVPISVCVRPAWRFGPVVEKVIGIEDADDQGLVFLDLETGQSRKPPFALKLFPGRGPAFVDLTPELQEWIRAQDVDILLQLGEKTWSMMTLEMQEDYAGQLNEWETVSAAKVVALFAAKDAAGLVRDEVPASSSGQSYSDGFGSFNAFRTRGNTMGVYQFEGLANSTRRGVSLRCKRVQIPALAPAGGMPGLMPGAPRERTHQGRR